MILPPYLSILIAFRNAAVAASAPHSSECKELHLNLASQLLNLKNYELCRFEGREGHQDIHHTQVDVVLGGSLFVALDQVGIARFLPLEGSLAEQVVHECAHV